MVFAFMMLYLTSQIGCSLSQAGVVMAIYGIGAIIGSLSGGMLSDKFGFYKVQVITLLLGGCTFLVLGQLKSYYAICMVTFLLGCINEAFRPANSSAIAIFSNEENRMRSFSLMRLSFNMGWAFGGGLGGLIASYSYHFLFWIDGVTNILAALLLWKLLRAHSGYRKPEAQEIHHKNIPAYKDKVFMLFVGITLLFTGCFMQLFTNLSAYFKRDLHFSERYIGLLLAWNGTLIVLVEMVLVFWIERHWTKRKSVIIGVLLHALAYLLLVVFNMNATLAFLMITLVTLSEMFAFSVLVSFWMTRTNDYNRGQYAGIWTMSWAIAQSTAPFFGAVVAQYLGFNYLWMIVVFLSVLSAILYARLIRN